MIKQKQIITSILSIFALMLLIVSYLDGNGNTSGADYMDSIMFGRLNQTYLIHIPSSHDKSKSKPLVITLHRGGGSAEQMVEHTKRGFTTLSDKEEFIMFYPDGIKKHWNDGRKEMPSDYKPITKI